MADFQRRHYQAIAAMIAKRYAEGASLHLRQIDGEALAADLADYFAADNPAFNRAMFEAACRGETVKRRA